MTVLSDCWETIPTWPNYQACPSGQIKSYRTGRILSQSTKQGKHPYQRVNLSQNGKAKCVLVHRLILETFVGPCPEGCQTLHLDNNPKNNHLDNLCWGTPKENHSTIDRKGPANGRAKLTVKQVKAIRISHESHALLARRYNVSDTTIQNIRNFRLWPHV